MGCQIAIKVRQLYFLRDVTELTYRCPRHINYFVGIFGYNSGTRYAINQCLFRCCFLYNLPTIRHVQILHIVCFCVCVNTGGLWHSKRWSRHFSREHHCLCWMLSFNIIVSTTFPFYHRFCRFHERDADYKPPSIQMRVGISVLRPKRSSTSHRTGSQRKKLHKIVVYFPKRPKP